MSKEKLKMKLGIQPTGWTNDDFPEIGNDTPYQIILDQTKEAGFEGGSTGHNYPSHMPSLLNAVHSRKLEIASTWAGTSFTSGIDADAAFASFVQQLTYLEEVGAKDVVVAELYNAVNQVRTKELLTERPILNEPQWYLLTTLMDRAGKYAKDQGMQLSYHPHVGTCVMTIAEAERFFDNTNPDYVGLCIDTAHLVYGGASQEELVAFAEKYKHRITHVHLKNVRGSVVKEATEKKWSFYNAIEQGVFTVPGDPEGTLNLDPIMNIIKSVDYNRWMIIEAEQNPLKADPLAHAKMAREYLRKHLGY
jgi:inosose dehydratase